MKSALARLVNPRATCLEVYNGQRKVFYYPQPDGRHLVEIDMGEALGELQSTIQHDAVDAITQSGGIYRSVSRGAEFVNIQRDRMQLGEDLAVQFEALQNHLDRGFSCMAVSDHAKAWAASAIPSPNGGDYVISVGNAVFTDITGTTVDGSSLVPVAGDYLVIETDSPPWCVRLWRCRVHLWIWRQAAQ